MSAADERWREGLFALAACFAHDCDNAIALDPLTVEVPDMLVLLSGLRRLKGEVDAATLAGETAGLRKAAQAVCSGCASGAYLDQDAEGNWRHAFQYFTEDTPLVDVWLCTAGPIHAARLALLSPPGPTEGGT